MGLMSLFNDLINEHGSATILKERLLLLRDQLAKIEAENERLTEENRQIKSDLQRLQKELEKHSSSEDFVKYRGVLFLRLPNGEIQDEAYCPLCRGPMFSLEGFMPFCCTRCNVTANFSGRDVKRIVAEIV